MQLSSPKKGRNQTPRGDYLLTVLLPGPGYLIELLDHEGELPEHVVEVGVDVDHAVVQPLNLHSFAKNRVSVLLDVVTISEILS